MPTDTLAAREATGHTTMRQHEQGMRAAVTKAIQGDPRFMPSNKPAEQANVLQVAPCCIDVTTPDQDGTHHAIIRKHDGSLVKHGFDYDHEEGKATMHDGECTGCERKEIYATEATRHENMIKAMENTISCRAGEGNGVQLTAKDWVAGKPVSYIYVPGGITTINAGFRRNESITCTVQVDEDTAKDLQSSFDFIAATEKQEPYADEDHESKKATLRFPARKVNFTYGTHRGEEGVIVSGAEPTSYGAEAVNGKVYASWSPEFATDADYSKARCKKGHWTFPDGVRGSASNPARLVAVNFVTGALTNKPAFKNMPNVKAKHVAPPGADTVKASGTSEGVKKSWEKRHGGASEITRPGQRIVTVAYRQVHGAAKQFPYTGAKVYESYVGKEGHLKARPLYEHGPDRRSERLSEEDAISHAKEKGLPFHHGIRQGFTFNEKFGEEEDERVNKHRDDVYSADDKLESSAAPTQDKILTTIRIEDGQVVKAAWSEAARAAALEARKHGSYGDYADDAHEASKRALDLSRTAQGHHQDRRAHREAAEAHENAATGHSYAATETDHKELIKHHEAHMDFHQKMAGAHLALHDSMRTKVGHVEGRLEDQPVIGKMDGSGNVSASEVTAAQDLITATLECVGDTVKASGTSEGAKAGWQHRAHLQSYLDTTAKWETTNPISKDSHETYAMENEKLSSKLHEKGFHDMGQIHHAIAKYHEARGQHGMTHEKASELAHDHVFDKKHESKYADPKAFADQHLKMYPVATAEEVKNAHAKYLSKITQAKATTPLDHIIARHNAENDVAVAIAIRTPEVKAALDAEAARIAAASRPDEMMDAILARQAEERAFEERLLASNPVAANHDALAAIAERNSQTVTAAGTSEGAKSGWETRKGSGTIETKKGKIHFRHDAKSNHMTIETEHKSGMKTLQYDGKMDPSGAGHSPEVAYHHGDDSLKVTQGHVHQMHFKPDWSPPK